MNIFKILSSGDQKLKEPAVTSFIAYLLDPYEGHGLKAALLNKILKPIVEEDTNNFKDLIVTQAKEKKFSSTNLLQKFEVEVNIEVSKILINEDRSGDENNEKKKNKKRADIDIVLKLHPKDGNNTYAFCIENKIQDGAIGKENDQLITQLKAYLSEVSKLKDNLSSENDSMEEIISSIFLTPDSVSSDNYFKAFKEKKQEDEKLKAHLAFHIAWQKTDDDKRIKPKNTIYDYLKEILSEEAQGTIEPIHDYTKHTIKAFMNFIDSGFKSIVQEKNEEDKYKKEFFDTEDEFFEFQKSEKQIPDNIIDLAKKISSFISKKYPNELIYRYSPTHYSIFLNKYEKRYKNGSILARLTLWPKKIEIDFQYKNISTVSDHLIQKAKTQKSWPNGRKYDFLPPFEEGESKDLTELLDANYKSININLNKKP